MRTRRTPATRASAIGLLILSFLGVAAETSAADISGAITLTSGGRTLLAQEASQAVVYFRPDRPIAPPVPKSEFVMRTRAKSFDPQILAIPVGASVRFPNNDPILHNVFSSSGRNAFDLGIYGRGAGEAKVFAQPGLVRVYCNVHREMVAHILVLDTPYVVRPDTEGRYRIDLRDGVSGELFVWHPRASLWRKRLDGKAAQTIDIDIALDRPLVPPHPNKFGRPYEERKRNGY